MGMHFSRSRSLERRLLAALSPIFIGFERIYEPWSNRKVGCCLEIRNQFSSEALCIVRAWSGASGSWRIVAPWAQAAAEESGSFLRDNVDDFS